MKAKIEKRLIRAKKEVQLIEQKYSKIQERIHNLNSEAQQLVNQSIGKKGAVTELEEILAGLFVEKQVVKQEPNRTDQSGTVQDQIGKSKGRV